MTVPEKLIYPRDDHESVYLKYVIKNPNITVGDYTFYNDFVHDPADFEKNKLKEQPVSREKTVGCW